MFCGGGCSSGVPLKVIEAEERKGGRELRQSVLSDPVWPWPACRGLEHESYPGALPPGATFSSHHSPVSGCRLFWRRGRHLG